MDTVTSFMLVMVMSAGLVIWLVMKSHRREGVARGAAPLSSSWRKRQNLIKQGIAALYQDVDPSALSNEVRTDIINAIIGKNATNHHLAADPIKAFSTASRYLERHTGAELVALMQQARVQSQFGQQFAGSGIASAWMAVTFCCLAETLRRETDDPALQRQADELTAEALQYIWPR